MIFGETREQKIARLDAVEPRPWFAWFPVRLRDGRKAWLQTVNRYRYGGWAWWIYEAPEKPHPPARGRGQSDG